MTRQKLLQLGWQVLIHLPYSSDIAPLDFLFFFFGLYKILLMEKTSILQSSRLEDCRRHLEQLFAQKDKKFWVDEIMKLPERWQKVVEQNSEYIVQ